MAVDWAATDDKALEADLNQLATDGKVGEYVATLLVSADQPEFEFGGMSISIRGGGIVNDKSCYKKCLKEDIKNPGSYAKCIKKCRPSAGFSIDIAPA
jgi:hypothetical protein